MERAKLIMAVDHHSQAAAVFTKPVSSSANDIQQLQQQLAALSEQRLQFLSVMLLRVHNHKAGEK